MRNQFFVLLALAGLALSWSGCARNSTQESAMETHVTERAVSASGTDDAAAAEAPHSEESPAHEGSPADSHDDHHVEHGFPAHHGHHPRFDNPEDFVARWNSPERDEWQQPARVIELMEIAPGMKVADLGTGTGYFVPFLADAVGVEGRVIAADVEQAMVDYVAADVEGRALAQVEARRVDADLPFEPEESLDRILTVNTWHHFGDRVAYAESLRASLDEGGMLIVVDYTMDAEPGPPMQMRLEAATIASELEAAGFAVTIHEHELPRQHVIVGRR